MIEKDGEAGHATFQVVEGYNIQSVGVVPNVVLAVRAWGYLKSQTPKRLDTSLGRRLSASPALPLAAMLLLPLLALLYLPFTLAASVEKAHAELVKLAHANSGMIKLDDRIFDLITTPKRDWSATIVFTALDPRRKCVPCKCASLFS